MTSITHKTEWAAFCLFCRTMATWVKCRVPYQMQECQPQLYFSRRNKTEVHIEEGYWHTSLVVEAWTQEARHTHMATCQLLRREGIHIQRMEEGMVEGHTTHTPEGTERGEKEIAVVDGEGWEVSLLRRGKVLFLLFFFSSVCLHN